MAKHTKKAKMGRPPLPKEKRKLATMGFRPTWETRKNIEDAAAASGRSMTQEVERRLERSFLFDNFLEALQSVTSGKTAN